MRLAVVGALLLLAPTALAEPPPAPPSPTEPRASGPVTPPAPVPPPETPQPGRPMLAGELKAEFRGAVIINTSYNDGTLYPGSVAYFGLAPAVSRPQFTI